MAQFLLNKGKTAEPTLLDTDVKMYKHFASQGVSCLIGFYNLEEKQDIINKII